MLRSSFSSSTFDAIICSYSVLDATYEPLSYNVISKIQTIQDCFPQIYSFGIRYRCNVNYAYANITKSAYIWYFERSTLSVPLFFCYFPYSIRVLFLIAFSTHCKKQFSALFS
ncbi:hypothetical protein KFK09_019069 [Dendrobium nobile]|uniref:Uncharacterized protein n=1 Tax=Dendrobium nobile TaxID=94219 RepID=A0A8T3AXM7_DENNO|nr:hypothetical protein KFK09_019069 [Dendrobium nobile]